MNALWVFMGNKLFQRRAWKSKYGESRINCMLCHWSGWVMIISDFLCTVRKALPSWQNLLKRLSTNGTDPGSKHEVFLSLQNSSPRCKLLLTWKKNCCAMLCLVWPWTQFYTTVLFDWHFDHKILKYIRYSAKKINLFIRTLCMIACTTVVDAKKNNSKWDLVFILQWKLRQDSLVSSQKNESRNFGLSSLR